MIEAISILGSLWEVLISNETQHPLLKDCDGYCDYTVRKIVVSEKKSESDLEKFSVHQKKVIRHELIHAFLFESGLGENWEHSESGHDETFIDWVAFQSPKIFKVFEDLNVRE